MGRLFIFQLTCTANSACQLPIKTLDELTNNGNATVVEFASFDSGPNIECDGVDIVKMFNIFCDTAQQFYGQTRCTRAYDSIAT